MEPSTTPKPRPRPRTKPKPSANKRKPLGDLTNFADPPPARSGPVPAADASPATPAAAKGPSGAEASSLVASAISTVYSRRKSERRRRTGEEALLSEAASSSCPPIGKVASTKKTLMIEDARLISSSVPCRKAKKKRHTRMDDPSSSKPKLPEDFVEKQNAYFAEVDAFELPEEEASEGDLE